MKKQEWLKILNLPQDADAFEINKAYRKYYNNKNKDKIRAAYKVWYENNKEQMTEYNKNYYKENIEKFNCN